MFCHHQFNILPTGVSDAFCAFAASFSTRDSKILFDEILFEKGKMFSLADGDFQVKMKKKLNLTRQFSDPEVRVLQFPAELQHGSVRPAQSLRPNGSLNTVSRSDKTFLSTARRESQKNILPE